MIVCSGCARDVEADATVCPFCQAPLSGGAPPAEGELSERVRAAETLDALAEGPPGFAETADDLDSLPPGALADTADELDPIEPEPTKEGASLGLIALVVVLGLIVLGGIAGILVLLQE